MNWNHEIAGYILKAIYFILLIFLILKRKYLGKGILVFILAMVATILTETFGFLYRIYYSGSNYFIFNVGITLVVFFLFYLYYYVNLENPLLKKIQLGIISTHLIAYIFSVFWIENFMNTFLLESYMFQVVLLLMTISMFFYETFNSEKIFRIKKHYSFWISISLLIIYIGILPALIVGTSDNKALNTQVFKIIMFCVNFLGYTLLLYGAYYSSKLKN